MSETIGIVRDSKPSHVFMRVRSDLRITQVAMGNVLGVTQALISSIELGKRNPGDELRGRLRDLAFNQGLPYAVDVFPEVDDPLRTECPNCVALRHRKELVMQQNMLLK